MKRRKPEIENNRNEESNLASQHLQRGQDQSEGISVDSRLRKEC